MATPSKATLYCVSVDSPDGPLYLGRYNPHEPLHPVDGAFAVGMPMPEARKWQMETKDSVLCSLPYRNEQTETWNALLVEECETCDGVGSLTYDDHSDCSLCMGRGGSCPGGHLVENEKCPTCEGEGFVEG